MSDFLQMNLNRMSGIRDKTGQIADRRTSVDEAKKSRLYDAFKTGGQAFTQGLQAKNLRDFTTGENYDRRAADAEAARKLANERAGMRADDIAKYEDGSYHDSLTGKDYQWNDEPTFELIKSQMDRDRDRYFKINFPGGKAEEPTDIYGAFQNTLGELTMIFSDGGFDPSTLRYSTEWMLQNKDNFKSAFNEFTSSKYSLEEQTSLNRLLDQYLDAYQAEVTDPKAVEGGDGIFVRLENWLEEQKTDGNNITGGYGNTQEQYSPFLQDRMSDPNLVTGGYDVTPQTTDQDIRKDFFDTLSTIKTAQPTRNLGGVTQWNKMMNLLLGINQTSSISTDQMREIDRKMERAEEGKLGRSELDKFIMYLQKIGSTGSNQLSSGSTSFSGYRD